MKVILSKNEAYLMHWETRKFKPATGRNTDKELEATDCIIRRAVGETITEVGRGHVSQTACDQQNSVMGRRLSFLKAIKDMPRSIRKVLGDEYNNTCRVVSTTNGRKNRKLKNRIAELEAKVAELEAVKEEALV